MEVSCTKWLQILKPRDQEFVSKLKLSLHAGEAEAIALARELSADLLLIDECRGRRIARRESLRVVGVLGVLGAAKKKGLIPVCSPLIDALRTEAHFRLSEDLRAFLKVKGRYGRLRQPLSRE